MNFERVKMAKDGDVDAIGEIIVENMQSMYRVAFSILKNEEEIYDAISNTTVIVFEKISELKKMEFFKTWLTRILINECYKIYNQNKKVIYIENWNQEHLEKAQFTENEQLSDMDIKRIIQELNQELRETVTLYYFEDFSVKEIAKILQVPEGTVKSRLSRSRKILENALLDNDDSIHKSKNVITENSKKENEENILTNNLERRNYNG